MAWSNVSVSLGTAASQAASSTLVLTTTAAIAAGNVGVILVACDNAVTTNGAVSEITSVVDSAGNTWQFAYGHTRGSAAVNSGVHCGIWYCVAATTLASSGTITITFAHSPVAKAAVGAVFSTGGGTVSVAGSDGSNGGGTLAAAVTLSGLPNVEYLYIHARSWEWASGTTILPFTASVSCTVFDGQYSQNTIGATRVTIGGEWKIETSTGTTFSGNNGSGGNSGTTDQVRAVAALLITPPPAATGDADMMMTFFV